MSDHLITRPTGGSAFSATRVRRGLATLTAGGALLIAGTAPAVADPGNTFPEAPGSNPQQGCISILSLPNSNIDHNSARAAAIVFGLVSDACGVV